MKLVNSRKWVLLHVYQARKVDNYQGRPAVFYDYSGEISGSGPLDQVHRAIATIKADSPSAKLVGFLPEGPAVGPVTPNQIANPEPWKE